MPGLDSPLKQVSAALVAFTLVVAALSAARALGLADGATLAATPASALALAAGVLLRWRGALAAGLGFLAGDLLWGLPPAAALADAAAHGTAALLGSGAMRTLARRRGVRNKTSDWLIFLAGVAVYCGAVVAVLFAASRVGASDPRPAIWRWCSSRWGC